MGSLGIYDSHTFCTESQGVSTMTVSHHGGDSHSTLCLQASWHWSVTTLAIMKPAHTLKPMGLWTVSKKNCSSNKDRWHGVSTRVNIHLPCVEERPRGRREKCLY